LGTPFTLRVGDALYVSLFEVFCSDPA
jgi:hypothetical protein